MSHYTREQWQRYIKNELGEDARRKCEDHLYHCDQCLELYLEALALCEADLPDMKGAVRFTDMVMEKIGQSAGDNPWETGAGENARVTDPAKTAREKTEKTPFYNRTAFHFCIAAAATWLFLVTGVFEKVAEIAATVKAPEIEEEAPSLTEELLDKTFTLIDSVNTKLEEGNE